MRARAGRLDLTELGSSESEAQRLQYREREPRAHVPAGFSAQHRPGEAVKHDRAVALVGQSDGALSMQVLQEFYGQATRPTRQDRLLAVELMDVWRQRFRGQEMTLPLLDAALRPRAAHQLSFWDYAIIAAARALGCRRLHSENMGDGREIDGVRIVNPFR